jgi:hypothetical protein
VQSRLGETIRSAAGSDPVVWSPASRAAVGDVLTECRPVLSNSAIGLLSTILRIYAEQGGEWSITAVITGSIILTWFAASGVLFIYIEWILIPRLKSTPVDAS